MSFIFLFVLVSLVAPSTLGQEVRVSDCGGTITAGQNCSLKCTLTGVESQNPTITYKWLKYNGTQQVEVGTGSNVLSFPSLNLSDAGQYTCQVTVDSQMYGYTEYIHIQIPPPTSLNITSDPVSPIRPVGSNVTLTCTVKLRPVVDVPLTIEIQLTDPNGTLLAKNTSSATGSVYIISALVSSFGREKSGRYTCTVTASSTSLFLTDSRPHSTTSNVTVGAYMSLKDTIYANNSIIFFSEIGTIKFDKYFYDPWHFYDASNTLTCNTDKMPCCRNYRYGQWFFPNGSKVLNLNFGSTMFRSRWFDGTISLSRRNDTGSYATGLFCCVVPDAADIEQTLCANVVIVMVTSSGMDTTGESYVLECFVIGANDTTLSMTNFQWFDEHGNHIDNNGSATTVDNVTSGNYNLHFSPLQQYHEGKYTCKATVYGTTGSKSVNLTVKVPAVTVNISDRGVVPTAGTSFRLICNIFGAESLEASITYKWKTGNSTHTYVINNSKTLFFGSLQLLDSKEYSCEVTVNSPYLKQNITNTSSYQLLLELPAPIYMILLSDQPNPIRPIGSNVTLTCTVESRPTLSSEVAASIQVTGPTGSPLITTAPSVSGPTYTSTTMVTSFGREESGVYTCTATTVSLISQFHTVSKPLSHAIRLTTGVYLSLKGVFYHNNSLLSITDVGETIYNSSKLPLPPNDGLQCVTDLKPCCYSNITTGGWYFPDGRAVPNGGHNLTSFYVNRGNDGTVTLNLAKFKEREHPTGVFCCSVPDVNSTTQLPLCVNILPEISACVNDGGTDPKAGEKYTLSCDVSGAENLNLFLSYQWIKNNGTQTQLGTDSRSLLMSSVRISDAGRYSCRVNATSPHYNGAINIVSKHLDVVVQVPEPVVRLVSITPNPILSGSSPTLTCTVELDPTVDVPVDVTTVWSGPDGSTLSSDASPVMKSFTHYTSKLTLNYVESADSGNYTCTVSIRGKVRASVRKEIIIGDGMFQLSLLNTDICQSCCKCKKYDKDLDLYMHIIEKALIEAVESRCECHFPEAHLFEATFSCTSSPNLATYRNTLIGTHNFNATQLIGFIQDWVTSGPRINVKGLAVRLDKSCPVAIASLNDPECGEVSQCPCANDPNVAKCVEHLRNEDFAVCIDSCI